MIGEFDSFASTSTQRSPSSTAREHANLRSPNRDSNTGNRISTSMDRIWIEYIHNGSNVDRIWIVIRTRKSNDGSEKPLRITISVTFVFVRLWSRKRSRSRRCLQLRVITTVEIHPFKQNDFNIPPYKTQGDRCTETEKTPQRHMKMNIRLTGLSTTTETHTFAGRTHF